jgi:hypothetical protein
MLQTILPTMDVTWEKLTSAAADKRSRRGGFDRRLFLEYTEQAAQEPPVS